MLTNMSSPLWKEKNLEMLEKFFRLLGRYHLEIF